MASFSEISIDRGTLRRVRSGDRDAQATLYRAAAPTVMGMARRILQDVGLAQEVVQDTFVELLENAHKVRDEDALLAWIRRVAVNHCLMRLRSPWHRHRIGQPVEDEVDACDESARQGDLRDLETALGQLLPETRAVLWLHDVEGYTHKEIGRLVGNTTSYSKSQLARGHSKLSKWFEDQRVVNESETVREVS